MNTSEGFKLAQPSVSSVVIRVRTCKSIFLYCCKYISPLKMFILCTFDGPFPLNRIRENIKLSAPSYGDLFQKNKQPHAGALM